MGRNKYVFILTLALAAAMLAGCVLWGSIESVRDEAKGSSEAIEDPGDGDPEGGDNENEGGGEEESGGNEYVLGIINAFDGAEGAWKLAEAGITAEHFSNAGVSGIDSANFDALAGWFDILCPGGSAPENLDELKALVDAALICIAAEDEGFLDAARYADRGEAEAAISDCAANGTGIEFDWESGDTVTVRAGRYEKRVAFNGDVPFADAEANLDPAASDFDISGTGAAVYDGSAKAVTVTPKAGKSGGAITVYYNGAGEAPIAAGTYAVTFGVAAAEGWNAAEGLAGGVLTVSPAAGDFGSPAAIGAAYAPALTLADLLLPEGYAWDAPATALNAGNGQQFPAAYTDPSGNYEPASGNITVNIAKAAGAAAAAPTLASATTNSITVNAAAAPGNGQTVEYAISASGSAPTTGWQTGLTFNGLSAGTAYYVFARSAGNGNYNAGAAAGAAVTTIGQESFVIAFADFLDIEAPAIDAGIIYIIGGTGKPISATITVPNAEQYGAENIAWHYNGELINAGETCTVSASSAPFNRVGEYSVTVFVDIEGKLYSKIIAFEVKP